MHYQVPQFIETEDKILGPFSIRQFFYICGAGGVSFLLYFTVQTWLWLFLSLIIVGSAVAFSLIKVNGQPLSRAVLSAFMFYWQPQLYLWHSDTPGAERATVARTSGFSLEGLMEGIALRRAWEYVQTGRKAPEDGPPKVRGGGTERYQILTRLTGERQAARRVDYR